MKKSIFLLSTTVLLASCAFEQQPAPYQAYANEYYGKGSSRNEASDDYIGSKPSNQSASYASAAPVPVTDDYNSRIDQQNSSTALTRPLSADYPSSRKTVAFNDSVGYQQKPQAQGEVYKHQNGSAPIAIDGNEDVIKLGPKPGNGSATARQEIKPIIHSGGSTEIARNEPRPVAAREEESIPPLHEKKPQNLAEAGRDRKLEDKLQKVRPVTKPKIEEDVASAPAKKAAPAKEEAEDVAEVPAAKPAAKVEKIETSAGAIEKSTPDLMEKEEERNIEKHESIAAIPEKPVAPAAAKKSAAAEDGSDDDSDDEDEAADIAPIAPKAAAAPAPAAEAEAPAPAPSSAKEKKVVDVTPSAAEKAGKPKFIKPVDGVVVGEFGGDKEGGAFNDGINIQAPEGTPVKAASGGTVVYSGNQLQGYGNLIIIRHPNGYLTAYSHLKELELKKGENVAQGEVLGHVGKTGNVETPQLHFGIRKGREPVDPKDYL